MAKRGEFKSTEGLTPSQMRKRERDREYRRRKRQDPAWRQKEARQARVRRENKRSFEKRNNEWGPIPETPNILTPWGEIVTPEEWEKIESGDLVRDSVWSFDDLIAFVKNASQLQKYGGWISGGKMHRMDGYDDYVERTLLGIITNEQKFADKAKMREVMTEVLKIFDYQYTGIASEGMAAWIEARNDVTQAKTNYELIIDRISTVMNISL